MRNFGSIEEFILYLRTLPPLIHMNIALAVRDAGRMVQEEAQHEIGHYQDAEGPFPAWPQLSDSTLFGAYDQKGRWHPGKVDMGFSPPDNPLLRTGDLKHAIELSYDAMSAVIGVPDEMVGDGSHESPVRNVGVVAAELEFGTENMPPRSFLGRSMYVCAHEIVSMIGHAVRAGLEGRHYVPEPRHHHSSAEDIPF